VYYCEAILKSNSLSLLVSISRLHWNSQTLQVKVGTLSNKSYVPAGMSKAQYEKIRAAEQKKKDANYDRNAKKAGVFEDYTAFYTKRGTDTKQAWYKDPNRGHRMAKTKYSFNTDNDGKNYDGAK